jgi:uncharacterized membrane protein YuzA (DUF378 family)
MCTTRKLVYLRMVVITIVLIGAINWGLVGLVKVNVVQCVSNLFNKNHSEYIEQFLYMVVGLCGVILIVNRNTFLPFLGPAVFPEPLSGEVIPEAKGEMESVNITDLPPNTKVIYWASNSSDKVVNNPVDAYGKYENQGIAIANNKGEAVLKVNKPTPYVVPSDRLLKAHVHYRYWTSNGMTSEIKTVLV